MNANEFKGQCAIVTGAASGIGREVARLVARNGGNVGCLDVNADGLRETKQFIAHESPDCIVKTATADVASEIEIHGAMTAFEFERVHYLFNVAGVIWSKPFLECTTDDLLRIMRINVGSIITMTAAVAPLMTSGGVIINTSSASAITLHTGSSIYSASKNAVVFLTRFMAHELAERNIRVCAIGPGPVNTAMPQNLMAARGLPAGPDDVRKRLARDLLVPPPVAEPDELAITMCRLATPEFRYCTGTTLWVDAGINAKGDPIM